MYEIFSRPPKPRPSVIKDCFDEAGCKFVGVDFFLSAACMVEPDIKVSPSRIVICSDIGHPRFFVKEVDGYFSKSWKIGLLGEPDLVGTKVFDDYGKFPGEIIEDSNDYVMIKHLTQPMLGVSLFPVQVRKTIRNERIYSVFAANDIGIYTVVNVIHKVVASSDKLIFNVHGLGYSSKVGLVAALERVNPLVVIDIGFIASVDRPCVVISPETNGGLVDLLMEYCIDIDILPVINIQSPKYFDGLYLNVLVPYGISSTGRTSSPLDVLDSLSTSLLDVCIAIGSTDFRVI